MRPYIQFNLMKFFKNKLLFTNHILCVLFQDHVTDLLTTMDASQVNFDIVSVFSLLSRMSES